MRAETTTIREAADPAEAEEQFWQAFRHAAIGMALVGLDGRWLRVNPALCALVGYAEDELLATTFQAITHADDLDADLDLVRRLLAGEISHYHLEKRYLHRAGHAIWALLSVALVRDARGRPHHFVSQIQDITARRAAEEALRASEARARALAARAERQARDLALLDRVRTALARELDRATICRAAVEEVARAFGYTQVSLYLREGDALVLAHQVGYDRVIARIPVTEGIAGRVARTGRPVLLEDVRADPAFLGAIDGIRSEVCVPLVDEDRVAGILNVESVAGVRLGEADLRVLAALSEQVGIALGRARLHAALLASEARLRTVVDNAPLMLFALDRDGVIQLAEGRGLARRGRTPGDYVGRSLFEVHAAHPAILAGARAALAGETTVTTSEQGGVAFETRYLPLRDAAGAVAGAIGVSTDVTERVRAEARLLGLHAAAVELAAVRDPRRLMPALLERAVGLLGTSGGVFYRWDHAAGLLRAAHTYRLPAAAPVPELRPGEGAAGRVYLERRTVLVDDYPVWEHATPSGRAAGLRAALAVPLARGGSLLGVLVACSFDAARFTADDARLLELFGDLAAVALENARLDDIAHAELAERRRAEVGLRVSEARLRALAGAAFEGIVLSEGGVVLEANSAFCELFGYPPEAVAGRPIADFAAPESLDAVRTQVAAGGTDAYEAVGLRADGARFPVEVRGRAATLGGRAVRVTAIRDLTERKRHEAALAHQATHDALTGLPNRAHLLDRLAAATARGPVAALFLDLDGFKAVNDRLGHAAGDELLVRVAARLRAAVRPGDLVARLGGDEFVAVLPGVADPATSGAAAARLLAALAAPPLVAEPGLGVAASAGVALAAAGDADPAGLLRRADAALYAAKRAGKGRYALWGAPAPAGADDSTDRAGPGS